jgi:hypothetical protein
MRKQRTLERRLKRAEKRLQAWTDREPDPDKPEVHAAQLTRAQQDVDRAQDAADAFVPEEQMEAPPGK